MRGRGERDEAPDKAKMRGVLTPARKDMRLMRDMERVLRRCPQCDPSIVRLVLIRLRESPAKRLGWSLRRASAIRPVQW
jgi:hypothetical protein